MTVSDVRLAGEGLVLRGWTYDDVPAMAVLFDDPQVARFTPLVSPFDAKAARDYLDRAREACATGRRIQLAITTDGAEPLGEVLMFATDNDPYAVEIGYAIGPRHRRQGLAARAVRLATAHAYGALGARRVLLRIEAANAPSRAVARATGFAIADTAPIERGGVTLDTWRHTAPPAQGGTRAGR
ncbi:GNAT family N-acetyltransferase [Streptomyces sp. NRRL F-5126]|uniref:GNAT family N-acetyltransferase n=1 Tax=Streptomyces sp. NRRL F-5126 TaxID=1463857 RepID=UPI00068CE4B4|nr:GNAT family N-acetyltransferase [Streptomyces sp. NRRL F-5126]